MWRQSVDLVFHTYVRHGTVKILVICLLMVILGLCWECWKLIIYELWMERSLSIMRSGQARYGSTCRSGNSPRPPFSSIPSAFSLQSTGPAPGPLTIPQYSSPAVTTKKPFCARTDRISEIFVRVGNHYKCIDASGPTKLFMYMFGPWGNPDWLNNR